MESGHCTLSQFTAMVFKAMELMKSKKVRRLRVRSLSCHARHYGIAEGQPITVEHIQSVLLYTDFTKLCSVFSASFRADHFGESLDSIKARNASWFEMSKLLRETVECFGNTKFQEKGPFYCGVNRLMVVPSFGMRLCSPTSTSKMVSVAIRFADTQGMVMRFNNDIYGSVKFFDCSYVSAFTEESERLFFGGDYRIRVESVLVIESCRNYQHYFRVFYALDSMLNCDFQGTAQRGFSSKDKELLNWFIDGVVDGVKDGTIAHDEYITDTFKAYCRNKRDIHIQLHLLRSFHPKDLHELLVHRVVGYRDYKWSEPEDALENMVRWKRLFSLFPSMETLTVYGTSPNDGVSFPFSINECLPMIIEAFQNLDSIKVVKIQGYHYDGFESWVHDAFGDLEGGSNLQTISVSMSNGQARSGTKIDIIRVERK